MTHRAFYPGYQEVYEYHGNTAIEIIRKRGGTTLWRQWIYFDTAEDADTFFNEVCAEA